MDSKFCSPTLIQSKVAEECLFQVTGCHSNVDNNGQKSDWQMEASFNDLLSLLWQECNQHSKKVNAYQNTLSKAQKCFQTQVFIGATSRNCLCVLELQLLISRFWSIIYWEALFHQRPIWKQSFKALQEKVRGPYFDRHNIVQHCLGVLKNCWTFVSQAKRLIDLVHCWVKFIINSLAELFKRGSQQPIVFCSRWWLGPKFYLVSYSH